ncbi:glycosyltransferase family 4 protein [Paenibacillus sp.]|uniref:glycosyltransferase family 4 protein n=1 Tax=Paenibacillus sp. TaxID=58172 RepID=UPI002811C40D|nr:glycosyltransferase family 4 protein [Paenibacillus sp.]
MKVLHLPYGGQMVTLCAALRDIGVEATACHFERSNFRFQADLCLHLQDVPPSGREAVRREFFRRAAAEFDVFHFHCGLTFFPDHGDLELLKALGKKVVMQHRGSDVRRLSLARDFGNPYVEVKTRDERRIEADLRKLSARIDHAIVADYELLPYVQDFYKEVHVIRQAIRLERFEPRYPSIDVEAPLVVHAPSHPIVKGTMYVSNAMWRLERGGVPVRYRLLRRAPHEEAIRLYGEADIVVDQLRIGSFGILSLEGMALGKPVVCYIRDGLAETYPEGLPIANADPRTVYDVLRELIASPKRRLELGRQGRAYIEKHHDSLRIARQLEALYRRL